MRISDWSSDVCSSDLGAAGWAMAFAKLVAYVQAQMAKEERKNGRAVGSHGVVQPLDERGGMASARLQVVSAHDQRCSSDADAHDARVVPPGRRPDRLVALVPMTELQRYRELAARYLAVRSSPQPTACDVPQRARGP